MVYRRKEPEKLHQVVTYFDANELQRLDDFCKTHRLSKAKGIRVLFMYASLYIRDVLSKQTKEVGK